MTDTAFMRLAIAQARKAIDAGQSPFGAIIVRDSQLVAAAHNTVWAATDATAHAEVCVIREACRALATIDLRGCTIYSTTEPCPMCFAAIHWAHLDRLVYGATIADAATAGFRELPVSNLQLKHLGGATVDIAPAILQPECADLFREFLARGGKVY